MVAGHENVGSPRQVADEFGPDLHDMARLGADRQVFIGFAGHFAGEAADAFAGILKELVVTHFLLLIVLETLYSRRHAVMRPLFSR